ncbi:MAG: hypothetical protein ACRDRZ_00245 [Pseudonocardiaceae bacterium]
MTKPPSPGAQHAEHDEIHTWCYETKAWRVLTDGDYRRALELSQTAQQLAPKCSAVAILATAQECRAWAHTRSAVDHARTSTDLALPAPTPRRGVRGERSHWSPEDRE